MLPARHDHLALPEDPPFVLNGHDIPPQSCCKIQLMLMCFMYKLQCGQVQINPFFNHNNLQIHFSTRLVLNAHLLEKKEKTREEHASFM